MWRVARWLLWLGLGVGALALGVMAVLRVLDSALTAFKLK